MQKGPRQVSERLGGGWEGTERKMVGCKRLLQSMRALPTTSVFALRNVASGGREDTLIAGRAKYLRRNKDWTLVQKHHAGISRITIRIKLWRNVLGYYYILSLLAAPLKVSSLRAKQASKTAGCLFRFHSTFLLCSALSFIQVQCFHR